MNLLKNGVAAEARYLWYVVTHLYADTCKIHFLSNLSHMQTHSINTEHF